MPGDDGARAIKRVHVAGMGGVVTSDRIGRASIAFTFGRDRDAKDHAAKTTG